MSSYLLCQSKSVSRVRLLGKKLFVRYFGTTISVNVLIKAGGFEMHWVGGGGLKSLKGRYPPYNVRTSSCKCRRFMFFVFEKVIVVFFSSYH